MRPISARFSLRSFLGLACTLAAAGLLGACDRHSAQELPESYGHGSSHSKSFDTHTPDSKTNAKSFSDSTGTDVKPDEEEGAEHRAEPAGENKKEEPGRFFPKGS